MIDILSLIGRDEPLFSSDMARVDTELKDIINQSKFLVVGGAGSIGSAVVKEIFAREPKALDVVDISENNLVELVRDIRSSYGYISGEFATYAIDAGSQIFNKLISSNEYDYVLNLSALKHVRSEKDPYTLMRLIQTNIFNSDEMMKKSKRYFTVSSDKAANPANMMGASKRIMEMYAFYRSSVTPVSMARFANVAFSDGSLLYGFEQRMRKLQPIVAPNDVRRYFITPKESGELCLISAIYGSNRDIFFPKLDKRLNLIKFSDIAIKYLNAKGYEPYICEDENEARAKAKELAKAKKWACLFSSSDTTGEKDYEEFYTGSEKLDMDRFDTIGVIENDVINNAENLEIFKQNIKAMIYDNKFDKNAIMAEFMRVLPEFNHIEKGRYLDGKM
ncbi:MULTISPECIES: polysaccharide biosynthesis protein [Campylobacter]|uniref:UDP-GlcNac (UDP-linked N-acetylglucosamine) inverting 4,6-dehydratase n=1 Tax=Campylobacter vicugnae TaxID=1660076 RepID=A0A1X9T1S2_9BACT|nr:MULTISPECIES: polysaccharide biosynthesis protein [unclassified Campylobacter]ARR02482.1 UDP-GlcNac (UDP-linked N-acetylglucosamine) inverting 4,6-dehydratase [Campylobacter sp. RM8964]MBQ7135993.1 polysaccharide biosynthesis protein [Campylobacter sp.]